MPRASTRLSRQTAAALTASLAVHLLVALPMLDWFQDRPAPSKPRAQLKEERVTLLSEAQVKRLLKRKPPAPASAKLKPKAKPEPPKPKTEPPKGQVVEIPPPPKAQVPDQARLLSAYNSKVEREQVSARSASPTPRMRKSARRLISAGEDPLGNTQAVRREAALRAKPKPKRTARANAEAAKRPGPKTRTRRPVAKVTPKEAPKVAEGLGPFRPDPNKQPTPARRPTPGGGASGGTPAPEHWQALLPTLGAQDMAAADGSIDHIEDMDRGDRTMLNTREYRYAYFFNRVKRSVRRRWRAVDAHRRHDPRGRVYGVRDRATTVAVTLNGDGSLSEISITKDSGVSFLDEVAVRAFRDAQPFPNPPPGLRDPDGRIRFQFSFYLEIDGGGFRMFRSRRPPMR